MGKVLSVHYDGREKQPERNGMGSRGIKSMAVGSQKGEELKGRTIKPDPEY